MSISNDTKYVMEVDKTYSIGESHIRLIFITVIRISIDFAVLQIKNHQGNIIRARLHENDKKSLKVPFADEKAIMLFMGECFIEIPLVGRIYFQGGGSSKFLFQIGRFEIQGEVLEEVTNS